MDDKGEMSINILVENINSGLVTNYNAFGYVAFLNYCYESYDDIIAENTTGKSVNRFDGNEINLISFRPFLFSSGLLSINCERIFSSCAAE